MVTKMIFFAQIAGSLAFLIIVFYISGNMSKFSLDLTDPLLLSLAILCVTLIPFGYFYSRKTFSKINPEDPLSKKYPIYQSGLLIRLSFCQGIALFAVVNILITGNLFGIVFYFIAELVMLGYYPTPGRIGRLIDLTETEIELFY